MTDMQACQAVTKPSATALLRYGIQLLLPLKIVPPYAV